MSEGNDERYEIGYRKPPRANRFEPGQSGNPKGRPKGSRNFATAFSKELDVRITVTEAGRQKTMTKRDAVTKQLVNKAVAGDQRFISVLLTEARAIDAAQAAAPGVARFEADDQQVAANMLDRLRHSLTGEPAGQEAPKTAADPRPKGEG